MMLATVQSVFPRVPEFEWESESEMCRSWVMIKDYELNGLCDSSVQSGRGLREHNTIEDIKEIAEAADYDGFSIFSDTTEQDAWWMKTGVWFKKCPRD